MHDQHHHDKHVDEVRPYLLDLQEIVAEAFRAAVAIGGAVGIALGILAALSI